LKFSGPDVVSNLLASTLTVLSIRSAKLQDRRSGYLQRLEAERLSFQALMIFLIHGQPKRKLPNVEPLFPLRTWAKHKPSPESCHANLMKLGKSFALKLERLHGTTYHLPSYYQQASDSKNSKATRLRKDHHHS